MNIYNYIRDIRRDITWKYIINSRIYLNVSTYNFMNVFYIWILWMYHIQIQFQYLTYNQLPEIDRKNI